MGQSVATLMFGISRSTKGLFNSDGEPFWDDNTKPGKNLDWDDAPRVAYEGSVVGYPVACSVPYDDEGDLGGTYLAANIEEHFSDYIKAARERWDRFAAWAKKEHGKELPPPALWFTTDERA